MWCIGEITEEYRRRMYELLALYARPFDPREPVVCIDEKSLQLIGHSRAPLPMLPGAIAKDDYEYVRKGTRNLFVAVEPKAGQRVVLVTEHRGKVDFVEFMISLLGGAYATARRIHLVLDNLNIHFRKCFNDARASRRRQAAAAWQLHHTPSTRLAEHGGDQIGILNRQCLIAAWPTDKCSNEAERRQLPQRHGTDHRAEVHSTDADRKLGRHYVSLFTC
jgi:hypothetical protein